MANETVVAVERNEFFVVTAGQAGPAGFNASEILAKLIVLVVLLLTGCASEPPKPFTPGAEVDPPFGCTLLRQRNGEC